jgi:hypothetical protein
VLSCLSISAAEISGKSPHCDIGITHTSTRIFPDFWRYP